MRVLVNGKEVASGAVGELADDRPSMITLTFPVAMDHASVEMWVPRDVAIQWTPDDRSVALTITPTSSFSGLKLPETRSKDGSTIVDLLVVAAQHPPSVVVSTFTVTELLGGAAPPKAGAPRVSFPRASSLMPSADGTELLVAQLYDPTLAPAQIFSLSTRTSSPVSAPRTSAPYLLLGWAGNDRIAYVGERVWLAMRGTGIAREVADPGIAYLTAAAVSSRGAFVAAASRDKLVVVDLSSGAVRVLAGYRNDCQLLASPLGRIAWSADDRRIAVVECDSTAPTVVRTRVIDIATDRTIATIDGGIYGIASLLTGDFQVSREYTEQGQGARLPWVVFDFAGAEKMRYLARMPAISPDGRYLLDVSCCAGEGFSLRDLVAQKDVDRGFVGSAQWLRDGRLVVATR